MLCKVTLVTNL